MPRVTTHTASDRAKSVRRCTGCGQPIEAGQRYYHWTRRVGPKAGSFRHVACGSPRPTELSSRKTAQVDEAVQDYATPEVDYSVLDNLSEGQDTVDLDAGAFESAVEGVADTAEQVGEEYRDSVSNMPDSLQQGDQAYAMEDVADRLSDWANELRDKAGEDMTVDLPVKDEDSGDDWRAEAEEAIDAVWQDRASELDDMMGEVPEYEG